MNWFFWRREREHTWFKDHPHAHLPALRVINPHIVPVNTSTTASTQVQDATFWVYPYQPIAGTGNSSSSLSWTFSGGGGESGGAGASGSWDSSDSSSDSSSSDGGSSSSE